MEATVDRLDALERRLSAAEDELAIIRVIASYGPLVDSGRTGDAPALFSEDGVYDVSYGRMAGRAAFEALLASEEHQGAVRTGIAHVMGLPYVQLDGDRATAINCTQLYVRDGAEYRIFRVAQNVWTLRREPAGWRVSERINRLIGEADGAQALIAAATAVKASDGAQTTSV